jgi:hypothetical protein
MFSGFWGRRSSNPWPHARHYRNLTRAGHGFVTGKVKSTPWHGGPLDPESVSMTGNFAQLHKQGVLTVESQPGHCDHHEKKKSYLVGFLPTKHAHALDAALRRKGIVTFFYEYRTGRSFGSMDAYLRSGDNQAHVLTLNSGRPYTMLYHDMTRMAKDHLKNINSAAAKTDVVDRVCFFELFNPVFCKLPGVETVLLKEIKAIRAASKRRR